MRPERRSILEMAIVVAIASAVGIVGALLIDWFPRAASTQAGPIDTFWDVLLIVSIPIFVLVATIVVYAVKLFRVRPGQELQDGPPIHGNTRLEVIWTAIPATVIAALVVYAYLVLHDIEKAPAKAAQERRVHVIAQQFAWQFEYKGPGGKTITANDLYLPVGESVRFDVNTKDVLHDFWVPEFRMKIDTVPGITTHYRVTPNRIGTYKVVCAELCGLGHAFMRATVHVLSRSDFDAWLRKAGQAATGGPAASGMQSAAADGKKIFTAGNGTSTACAACHTLADAGATGTTGPNLDKVIAQQDAATIRTNIVDPNKEIAKGYPAGVMPQDYEKTLSPQELNALVNYLVKVTHT